MKHLALLFPFSIIIYSCNKVLYGTYNTRGSKDKSAFLEINLNSDNTVDKTEIHTTSDYAKGRYIVNDGTVICYFDSSRSGFPPDTLSFKLKGKKLFFVSHNIVNERAFLLKQ